MPPPEVWHVTELGSGAVCLDDDGFRLRLSPASSAIYHDAQVSDYENRADFALEPPLRLSLRARADGELRGTAGFGFWNHAFMPGQRSIRPPQAVWFFFSSPPGEIALARGLPGNGWKAAVINAKRWRFLALLPLAPLGFLLMRQAALYRSFWPIGQRAIGVEEALLDASLLKDWHSYSIEWRADGAVFAVDDAVVLRAPNTPRNKLGFIAWIDNQYAIVTPQGRFGWGLLDIPEPQLLYLRDIQIESQA